MTRFLRSLLLLMAFVGLFGQSTAMAMSPAHHGTMAMASMACCDDMPPGKMHGPMPCKKMTLQCIAAMGCAAAAMTEPLAFALASRQVDRPIPAWPRAAQLDGRSYGPEPDPPSIPI